MADSANWITVLHPAIAPMPDLVEQIKSHSQFPNAWAAYMNKQAACKRRREERKWGEGQYEGDGQGY